MAKNMNFFGRDGAKRLLSHLAENYEVFPLREWEGQNGIILRHDVDLSVEAAYGLFKIEQALGLRSSFFFLLTSPMYNILEVSNQKKLLQMHKAGFELGIHFDPQAYPHASQKEMRSHLDREVSILSSIIGTKVSSVSLHNPSIKGEYPIFDSYLNAYNTHIFGEDRYLSDSRMQFKYDPYEFLKRADKQVLQLLLHPMFYEHNTKFVPIFKEHVKRFTNTVDSTFSVNSAYREERDRKPLWTHIFLSETS